MRAGERLPIRAVLLLASCGAPAVDPPPPPAQVASETPAPPEPKAEAVRPAPPAIAPGTDEPPTQPSTRDESELYAPHWAKGGLPEIAHDERQALFNGLDDEPTRPGALAGAVLVCRVDVDDWTDGQGLFAAPDLATTISIGDNPRLRVRGDEDRGRMYVSIALATLAPGDRLRAQVVDRDVLRDQALGTVTGKYRGALPWVGRAGRATVECRALSGATLDRALAERLAGCDHVLSETARNVAFDPHNAADFGFAGSGLGYARDALQRAAAVAGWADPRVRRRVEWLQRIEQPFVAAAAEFLARTVDATPPATAMVPIVPGAFRGRVEQWACGPEVVKRVDRAAYHARRGDAKARGGCALRLQIERIGQQALEVRTFITSLYGIAAPRLVLSNGEVVPLEVLALEGGAAEMSTSRTLPPGETGTMVLIPAGHFTPTAEPRPVLVMTGPEDGSGQAIPGTPFAAPTTMADRVWLRVP